MKDNIDKENIYLEDKCDCVQSEDQTEKQMDFTVCDQSNMLTLIVPKEVEKLVTEKNRKWIKLSLLNITYCKLHFSLVFTKYLPSFTP